MSSGAVKCYQGHLFCAQCAISSTAKDFGIRDLKWSSSDLHQVLSWSGFTCCVCGVRGPLHRSTATDAAVAALPVRCGYTALDEACRWTGRRDQFDAHQHLCTEQSDTGRAPRRGTNSPRDENFHEIFSW